jgi:hypothetical protein
MVGIVFFDYLHFVFKMKKIFISIALLIFVFGCSKGNMLIISGKTDVKYDGTKVYLVPLPNPIADIVDSAIIKKGKFVFKKRADSVYISHITVSRKANAPIERLLIVVEPGELNVLLDTISCASGTTLNDKLQGWKDTTVDCFKKMSRAEEKSEREKISSIFEQNTVDFIKNNPNPLGGYLYFMYDRILTATQKKELDSLGINKWLPENER